MNTYFLNYSDAATAKQQQDFAAAAVIGNTLGANFDIVPDSNGMAQFRYDIPFSLSNIEGPGVKALSYDTRFQGVKEFLDKPYAVAGYVVSLIFDTKVADAYDVNKDLDDFQRYQIGEDDDEGAAPIYLYIGICNGTLTDSYAPFGVVGNNMGNGIVAIKFYSPSDLNWASLQDRATLANANVISPTGSAFSLDTTRPRFQQNVRITPKALRL